MMRTLTGFVVVLVLACGARGAGEKDEKIDGRLLIGTWEPKVRKAGELTSVEFTKDGKLLARSTAGKAEGTYTLDGNVLAFAVVAQGETTKGTVTVLKLTADELESKDKEGKIDAYKRVKAK